MNRRKLSLLVAFLAGLPLFATITCSVPDLERYLDNAVIIVDDGGHHHHDDDDGFFFNFDWWDDD